MGQTHRRRVYELTRLNHDQRILLLYNEIRTLQERVKDLESLNRYLKRRVRKLEKS